MIFDELKQYLITNSSQYNIQEIEIDDDNLKRIVDRILIIYSNYKPLKILQQFYVPTNHYQIKTVNDRNVIAFAITFSLLLWKFVILSFR